MQQLALNGTEVWAYVVETDDGLRVRFDIDDWQRLNLGAGQRVPVRVTGKDDAWLFVTNVTELPPIVWVTMARRVRSYSGSEATSPPARVDRAGRIALAE